MTSFSRSGETLLQRCLNAHPLIEIVHHLNEPDAREDIDLGWFLMDYDGLTISSDHPMLAHRDLKPGAVLLLKNATWISKLPRDGFTLVRNPFSVTASGDRIAPPPPKAARQRHQQRRWATNIDEKMVPAMSARATIVGFLALYNRKMMHDKQSGFPFVRYEDLTHDPEKYLRKIVSHLGLDWDDSVLRSHEAYSEGEVGHGGIKLWKPIHSESSDKYKKLPERSKSLIYSMTYSSLDAFGYEWDGSEFSLKDGVEGMM